MVRVDVSASLGGQLAQEEAGKRELHQLALVQGLPQHATQETIVQVRVLVDQVRLQITMMSL